MFFHYAKFFLFHFVGLFSLAMILAGNIYQVIGLVMVVSFYVLGDGLLGDDTTTPHFNKPQILTCQLWLALPLLAAIVFGFLWSVSPTDFAGFGKRLSDLLSYDFNQAKNETSLAQHVAGLFLTGLMIGMIGTITAHELTHRTWDSVSLFIGRWLLAFSFDTSFSIEHVYGHHKYVATHDDPATAPRGRNVYQHIVISTIKGNISAWHIEKKRLAKHKLPVLNWRNVVIRGYLMSVLLLMLAYGIGGFITVLWFVGAACWGKALLEIVNYIEHYGIIRSVSDPVEPKHSWNTNKRISSWSMFNLTRHSHHHAQGEVPYHQLKPYADAPVMINGYLTTLLIALIPPLWFYLMDEKLRDWDQQYGSYRSI